MVNILLFTGEPTPVEVPEFLSNPWFLSMYGWVLYNVIMLWVDRKKYDLDNDGLGLSEVGRFLKHEWIGMLVSLMLVPFVTPYTPWIWGVAMNIFGKDYAFTNMAYGGVGVMMMAIQYAISWFRGKKKRNEE